jgi:hypothetical protein
MAFVLGDAYATNRSITELFGQLVFPPDCDYFWLGYTRRLIKMGYANKNWNEILPLLEAEFFWYLYSDQPTVRTRTIRLEDMQNLERVLGEYFPIYIEACLKTNKFDSTADIINLIVKYPGFKKYIDMAIAMAEKQDRRDLAYLWRELAENVVYFIDRFDKALLVHQYQEPSLARPLSRLGPAPFEIRAIKPIEPNVSNSMRRYLKWDAPEPWWALLGRGGKRLLEGHELPPVDELIRLLDSKGHAPYTVTFERHLRKHPEDISSQLKLAAWKSINDSRNVRPPPKGVMLNPELDEKLFGGFAKYLDMRFRQTSLAWQLYPNEMMEWRTDVLMSPLIIHSNIMIDLAKKWLPELKKAISECPQHVGLWEFAVASRAMGLDLDFTKLVDYPQPKHFEVQQGGAPIYPLSDMARWGPRGECWEIVAETLSPFLPSDPYRDLKEYDLHWGRLGSYLVMAFLHTGQPGKANNIMLTRLNRGGALSALDDLCKLAVSLGHEELAKQWKDTAEKTAAR